MSKSNVIYQPIIDIKTRTDFQEAHLKAFPMELFVLHLLLEEQRPD